MQNSARDSYETITTTKLEALADIDFFPRPSKAQKEKILDLPAPQKKGS